VHHHRRPVLHDYGLGRRGGRHNRLGGCPQRRGAGHLRPPPAGVGCGGPRLAGRRPRRVHGRRRPAGPEGGLGWGGRHPCRLEGQPQRELGHLCPARAGLRRGGPGLAPRWPRPLHGRRVPGFTHARLRRRGRRHRRLAGQPRRRLGHLRPAGGPVRLSGHPRGRDRERARRAQRPGRQGEAVVERELPGRRLRSQPDRLRRPPLRAAQRRRAAARPWGEGREHRGGGGRRAPGRVMGRARRYPVLLLGVPHDHPRAPLRLRLQLPRADRRGLDRPRESEDGVHGGGAQRRRQHVLAVRARLRLLRGQLGAGATRSVHRTVRRGRHSPSLEPKRRARPRRLPPLPRHHAGLRARAGEPGGGAGGHRLRGQCGAALLLQARRRGHSRQRERLRPAPARRRGGRGRRCRASRAVARAAHAQPDARGHDHPLRPAAGSAGRGRDLRRERAPRAGASEQHLPGGRACGDLGRPGGGRPSRAERALLGAARGRGPGASAAPGQGAQSRPRHPDAALPPRGGIEGWGSDPLTTARRPAARTRGLGAATPDPGRSAP
jgi:hypothetical protein